MEISLFRIDGRLVYTKRVSAETGSVYIRFPGNNLQSWAYLLRSETAGVIQVMKIMKY